MTSLAVLFVCRAESRVESHPGFVDILGVKSKLKQGGHAPFCRSEFVIFILMSSCWLQIITNKFFSDNPLMKWFICKARRAAWKFACLLSLYEKSELHISHLTWVLFLNVFSRNEMTMTGTFNGAIYIKITSGKLKYINFSFPSSEFQCLILFAIHILQW